MDILKLIDSGINYEEGLKRFLGNHEMYERMLVVFINDENFKNAKKNIKDKNYEALFSCVHEIKGMSGNLSLTSLYNEASEFVCFLKNKNFKDFNEAFSRFENEYLKIVSAIEAAVELKME
ncbi:MAG: Hpt domain-containing protein [Lachnospiraceae bacterium]|nr:Hpt domain-containing protein [Lachnospiraceae bacterium]